jgi:hypothetical protein
MREMTMSEEMPADSQGKIVVFGASQIRRVWFEEQWYFSVVDIIAALTDSDNPRDFWYRMKKREQESSGIELSTFCRQQTNAQIAAHTMIRIQDEPSFEIVL